MQSLAARGNGIRKTFHKHQALLRQPAPVFEKTYVPGMLAGALSTIEGRSHENVQNPGRSHGPVLARG